MDELWMDYTVFALIRNPYDRAGSSYDYVLSRRKQKVRLFLRYRAVLLDYPSAVQLSSKFVQEGFAAMELPPVHTDTNSLQICSI
jgi:hypothetical protein